MWVLETGRPWSWAADPAAWRRHSRLRAPAPVPRSLIATAASAANITQVGVEGFAWYRHEHTVDAEGIGIEMEKRAAQMGAAMPEPQSLSHALDAEMFKWVADVLVQEAGITPLLHRLCVAPIMENGAIAGVIIESKAGREAILAKRVIDATRRCGHCQPRRRALPQAAQEGDDVGIRDVLDERRQ